MDRSDAQDAGSSCAAAGRSAPVPSWPSTGASVFAQPYSPRAEDGAPSGETHTQGFPGTARQSAASTPDSAVSHRQAGSRTRTGWSTLAHTGAQPIAEDV